MKSIVCLSLAMLSCGALADQTSDQPKSPLAVAAAKPAASFGYLDIDKDARLSRQEAKADWAVTQRFSSADTNNDGYLDEEEFRQLSRG